MQTLTLYRKTALLLLACLAVHLIASVVPAKSILTIPKVQAAFEDGPEVKLAFNQNYNNSGTAAVTPAVVGTMRNFASGYIGKAANFETNYFDVSPSTPAPYIDLGEHESLGFGEHQDFTVSFWMKFPNLWRTEGWPVIVANKSSASEVGWRITTDAWENLKWQMTVEGETPLSEVVFHKITDTEWHHITVIHDREGYVKFYVDGIEKVDKAVYIADQTGSIDSGSTTKIGVNGNGQLANPAADRLNVYLDDLRIYRASLSPAEVASLSSWYIRLPFNTDVGNIGSSTVEPTVVGTLANFVTGFAGKAASFATNYFDVSSGTPAPYIDLGDHDNLRFGNDTDFTVAFWLKFPDLWRTEGWPVLAANKSTVNEVGWRIRTDAYENLRWQMTLDGHAPFSEVSFHKILDTDWHHIAVTHDRDGYVRFYVDGVEQSDKAMDVSGYTGSLDSGVSTKIGVNGNGLLGNPNADRLHVHMDDFRIYPKALSASELTPLRENVTNLVLLENIGELEVGDETKPATYVMFEDKQFNSDVEGIVYQSSNPSTATVDASGTVTAHQVGQTTITAKYDGFSDSFDLNVVGQSPALPVWRTQLASGHPRLLATAPDFAALEQRIQNDARSTAWFDNIEQQADALMNSTEYVGEEPQRIILLGMMYHLTNDSDYADRAWLEMQQLMGKPLWDPDSYLILSQQLMSASIAYDWFYDAWTSAQRDELRTNIIEKGMLPGIVTYRLQGSAPYATNHWLGAYDPEANNWNTVANAALLISVLAIGEESPSFTDEIFDNGLTDIMYSLDKFNPHGGWFEGFAYWNYTWIYLSRLLGSLDTALGTANNPLALLPGISNSGHFPIHLSGAGRKVFNFGDSDDVIGDLEQMFYLSGRYNKPEYTQFQIGYTEQAPQIDPLSLLWYEPAKVAGNEWSSMPLDSHYPDIEVGSMRASWSDPEGTVVNFKAGAVQEGNGHMDLDAGTFVLDALGHRWFSDSGQRGRGAPTWSGYFSAWGPRWTYYPKRAEGHNTLVVNPQPMTGVAGDPDQVYLHREEYQLFQTIIEDTRSSAGEAYSIMDLTKAYADMGATSVKRGIALLNGRSSMLLQDEIALQSSGEAYSFLHVNGLAEVELLPGNQSALLTIDDKRLWVGLADAELGQTLQIMAAEPLLTSPNPAIQQTVPDLSAETAIEKLAVHVTNQSSARIAIMLIPLQPSDSIPSVGDIPASVPLSDWDLTYAGE